MLRKLLKSRKNKKGFTLIELIIVIAIIAILAAIALPKFMDVREKSNIKVDIANAQNIQLVVATLVEDKEITVPTSFTLVASDVNAATAISKLQSVETAKAKLYKGEHFDVEISATGDITISVSNGSNTEIVYPNPSSGTYKN